MPRKKQDLLDDEILGVNPDQPLVPSEPMPPALAAPPENGALERRLIVFRKIAAPLMAAIENTPPTDGEPRTLDQVVTQFAELIDSTIAITQSIARMLSIAADDAQSRWVAAGAAAEIVAAHYQATASSLSGETATTYIGAMHDAIVKSLAALEPPQSEPAAPSSPVGNSLKALSPVVSAIARFSFGREPADLLSEVTERLTTIAGEIAIKLGPEAESAATMDTGSPIYYGVLEVAGEFYRESHFAERDRLLEMEPDERKAYVQAHNRKIPMEPVWERFGLKMGMLEALAAYLPAAGTR